MEYDKENKINDHALGERTSDSDTDVGIIENADGLKRRLSGRQIQMIAIGGSIGTALFVRYVVC
jgi:amino acid permease